MTQAPQLPSFQDEAGLMAMIRQAPVAIAIVTGPEFVVQFVNKRQLQLWSRQEEEVLGQRLFDLFPEVEMRGFREKLNSVVGTGRTYKGEEVETEFYRDGQLDRAWFDFVYEPMRNRDGQIEGVMVVSTEVTENVRARKLQEKSLATLRNLRVEEEKYRSLFERMNQGFCLVEIITDDNGDPVDYRFLECNARFQEQTGLKNAPGHTARELVPNLEPHWFRIYGDVALTGRPTSFIEGSEAMGRWFEVHAYKLGAEESRKVAILFSDISEQRRSEIKLIESEERFRNLADSAPVMIWMTDKNGYCHYLNRQWYDYTGQSIEESHGLGWTLVVHPDEQRNAGEVFMAASSTASPFMLEYRLRKHDGSYRWMIDSAVPRYDAQGAFMGYIGTVVDIHDRKLAEQKIQQLNAHLELSTNSAQVGTWSYDLVTGKLEWSEHHKKMWGYQEQLQDLTYEDWYRIILEEDRDRALQVVTNAALDRTEYFNEYRIQRADSGMIHWMRSFGRFILDDSGAPRLLTGITVEVTDAKTAEQALRLSEERYRKLADELELIVADRTRALERSNEDLRQFAHVASHDLKEPIRKIITFHGRLMNEFGSQIPEKGLHYLGRMEKAAQRSQDMIEGLLLSTSLHATDLKTDLQDLNLLVSELQADLEVPIRDKQARIETGDLPRIEGIHMLLHHLFYNLITNALKFSRPGIAPVLEIRSALFERNGREFARLEFVDNGIGFEQANAQTIFQPFARLHSKDQFEGAGLGLAFCRQIAERHGGSIEAFGNPGSGSRFVVELPIRQ